MYDKLKKKMNKYNIELLRYIVQIIIKIKELLLLYFWRVIITRKMIRKQMWNTRVS